MNDIPPRKLPKPSNIKEVVKALEKVDQEQAEAVSTTELGIILDKLLEDIVDANFNGYNYALCNMTTKAINKLISEEVVKAENRMGEAIITRHKQASYQWEKTQSFIQSYQEQKTEDVHGVFAKLSETERIRKLRGEK